MLLVFHYTQAYDKASLEIRVRISLCTTLHVETKTGEMQEINRKSSKLECLTSHEAQAKENFDLEV